MTVPATPLSDPADPADPHPALAAMRESAPVHRVELHTGLPVWMVTRYDDVLAALSDPRLSNDPHHAGARPRSCEGTS